MNRIEGQRPPDGIPGLSHALPLEQLQKTRPDGAAKARQDEVDVSSRAKMLNHIAAAVATVPDIRIEKVSSIKHAIDAGTYSVASKDVADALIRDRLSDVIR